MASDRSADAVARKSDAAPVPDDFEEDTIRYLVERWSIPRSEAERLFRNS